MQTSNTTSANLAPMKFGTGFIGNMRTSKLRFKPQLASAIFNKLPNRFHRDMLILHTTDKRGHNFTYLACIAPSNSDIWYHIQRATNAAKAQALRKQADMLEEPEFIPSFAMDSDELPF